MTVAIEVIQSALEEIGEYQPGEPITDADAERGLIVLNDMMDQWSNENLACFAFLTQSFALINGKSDYTIGGLLPDIAGPRPLRIEQMYLQDQQLNNYLVNVDITLYDFNLISNRTINSQTPSVCYYDPQYPQATLKMWPIPFDVPYICYFTSYLQLNEFPGLTTEVVLPPGYVSAMKPNLAIRLAPFFGKQLAPVTIEMASMTLASVKRKNIILQPAYYDREIVAKAAGSYDIRSDTYGSRGSSSS